MIRVILPAHLQILARERGEVHLSAEQAETLYAILDALERRYPALGGTIRDYATGQRRPFLRFFACGEDLSHMPLDCRLPDAVLRGDEPLIILGAVAGG